MYSRLSFSIRSRIDPLQTSGINGLSVPLTLFQYPLSDRPPANEWIKYVYAAKADFQYPLSDRPPANRWWTCRSTCWPTTFSIRSRIDPLQTVGTGEGVVAERLSVSALGSTPCKLLGTSPGRVSAIAFQYPLSDRPPANAKLIYGAKRVNAFSIRSRIDPLQTPESGRHCC